jgi:hypothetical protein
MVKIPSRPTGDIRCGSRLVEIAIDIKLNLILLPKDGEGMVGILEKLATR